MRRQMRKASTLMPVLIKSCLYLCVSIWVSGSLMWGTTRKVCFLEQRKKVVFSSSPWLIFNVSCLSFMAVSEHKDVAPLSNSCIVPICGPALSQNGIGQTAQFRLMSVHLGKINLLNMLLWMCPLNTCNERWVLPLRCGSRSVIMRLKIIMWKFHNFVPGI